MTLPEERLRALNKAGNFLRDLLDPKVTPRVPKYIRQAARDVLKHLPSAYDIHLLRQQDKKGVLK